MEGLKTTANCCNDPALREALERVLGDFLEGRTLDEALGAEELIPPRFVVHAVAAGEASGKLIHLLEMSGRLLQEEGELQLHSLLQLLEPVILVLMGGIVRFLVLACFLPVYRLVLAG